MTRNPASIQAVDRAFAALERLAQGPATLSAVSAHLGITLPGATKILRTLEQHGLVRQTEGRSYVLAAGCCRLARAYCSQTPLVEVAWGEMTRVSLHTGHHSILAVMEGIEKVNLLRLDAMAGWRHLESQLPERVGPALTQATGRVLLAHVEKDVRRQHLAKYPLARFGGGLRDEAEMRRELEQIREAGHAILALPDIRYIAAPIRGPRDRVVASLGAHAAPAQDLNAVVKSVCAAAARVSNAYGSAPPPTETTAGRHSDARHAGHGPPGSAGSQSGVAVLRYRRTLPPHSTGRCRWPRSTAVPTRSPGDD